jgi:hypothetical protein
MKLAKAPIQIPPVMWSHPVGAGADLIVLAVMEPYSGRPRRTYAVAVRAGFHTRLFGHMSDTGVFVFLTDYGRSRRVKGRFGCAVSELRKWVAVRQVMDV